jgi:streptogramin lyase
MVHGGEQPVSNASIMLYAAGATGNGTGATNLLAPYNVTTDSSGSFTITGDYVCPDATTQVYLVAQGGNPGLVAGTYNSSLTLMAALGDCGALSSSSYIIVNEVTTVAAAWALAQFLGLGANVGSSSTNATGLSNAFSVANTLANTGTGLGPGAGLPPAAVTETAKLNTLADVLASCVSSAGGSACAPLFAAATVGSTIPVNTLEAALNIVRNPAVNVSAIFNLGGAQGPFQPTLSTQPNDWTMSLTYGNCTASCGGLDDPKSVAIDAAGNAWVANALSAVVSKFSPSGVPASAAGFPGIGLHESFGIAIDVSGNAWVTNQQSVAGADNQHSGSVSEFSPSGVELSGYGYTAGGIYYPQAAAADSNGDLWFADYGSSSATLLASDGSAISGSSGYGYNQLPFTSAVALDASHNAWFAAHGAAVKVSPAGVVTSLSCCNEPAGIAVDQTGNIWIADYGAFAIVELSSAGTVLNRVSSGATLLAAQGIAIDGSGNVWSANLYGNSITKIAGATATQLSPPAGYGLDAGLKEPYGIAIDGSGNLWITNEGSSTLTQIVGIASPVATPLLGVPAQP